MIPTGIPRRSAANRVPVHYPSLRTSNAESSRQRQLRFLRPAGTELAATIMAPAQHLVTGFGRGRCVGDHYLLALADQPAADHAAVEAAEPATPAQHLHLERHNRVRELEKSLATREKTTPEVGGQAEGVDVDMRVVDQVDQLLDLLRAEELRLVDDQVVHPLTGRPLPADELAKVGGGVQFDRGAGHADPGGDSRARAPVALGQDQSAAP